MADISSVSIYSKNLWTWQTTGSKSLMASWRDCRDMDDGREKVFVRNKWPTGILAIA